MKITKICKMCGAEFLGNTNARYCCARCRMDYQTQYARKYRNEHREQIREYNRKYQRGYSKLVLNTKIAQKER